MAETPALDLLLDRLSADGPASKIADLVLAAALGQEALGAAIGGEGVTPPPLTTDPVDDPPALFLGEIAVEGFRGIAGKARLGFRPGPGLTLVVGRNGSGKSSFAEAAELALTGTASRWERRSKVWEEGWACLHLDGPRSIEVKLLAEGQAGETLVRRRWGPTDGLAAGTAVAQAPGAAETPVEKLGLDRALKTWRPFLSYNELGGLLDDGPSRLYDAISAVLGLEEWVVAEDRLTNARKTLEATVRSARAEAERLRRLLEGVDDDRAAAALEALPPRKPWDLGTIETLATGAAPSTPDLSNLQAIASLPPIDIDAPAEAARELRSAAAAVASLAGSDAERAGDLASLLEQALKVHQHVESAVCPVCATTDVLDADWAARTRDEVRRLRSEAAAVSDAGRRLRSSLESARALLTSPPGVLSQDVAGVDAAAVLGAWRQWHAAPTDPGALAEHIEGNVVELASAVDAARSEALKELDRRQDLWQPVAAQLAAWLPDARVALDGQQTAAELKEAAAWLAEAANAVRNERFAPIAAQVQSIWETLRHDSNVALETVSLEGTKTRRRVELGVSVDDVAGAALSVMSQGELHSLALSLFLPRATLSSSPFRFVAIDDPVQAMDSNRVDGLARVLDAVAQTHQVIVFTHDERLPDACRRLDLGAVVLEVTRADRSQVTVRARRHPVDNYLEDARAVLATDDYPDEVRRRVIPGLCRNAIEAACVDATRRRLLAAGRRHAEIDGALESAGKLLPRLALALFGDASRSGDVLAEVNRRWGRDAGDCVQALRSGSHELIVNDPRQVVKDTDRLAHAIAIL